MAWTPLADEGGKRPARLADALDRVLAGLGAPPASTLEVVERAWPDLVGPAAAAALRPLAIRGGVLHVVTDDPMWRGQARWLESTVVEGLSGLLGPDVVTSMVTKAAPRAPRSGGHG